MRSKHATVWSDVSARPTDRLTDDKVYGFAWGGVVGSGRGAIATAAAADGPTGPAGHDGHDGHDSHGADAHGARAASDPRDFRGSAGAATGALNGAAMAVVDIAARRRPTGAGSSAVHPTAANLVVFGRDFDATSAASAADTRDFEGAAGGSVRSHARP